MFRHNFVEYRGQVRSNDSLFVHPICFIALRGGRYLEWTLCSMELEEWEMART